MKFRKKFGLSLSIALAAVIAFPAAGSAAAGLDQGQKLERIVVVHYVNAKASSGTSKSAGGYKLTGYKLSSSVSCSLNTTGLADPAAVQQALQASGDTWDAATLKEIFGTVNYDNKAKYGVQDGKNSIEFGQYSGSSSVIAVTSYWVNTRNRTIVEFDMLYNTYYAWGDASVNSSVMDIQNIATHEFGHAFGLADIYSGAYSQVTMYGYSNYGETSKRGLEAEDRAGIQKIYGQ